MKQFVPYHVLTVMCLILMVAACAGQPLVERERYNHKLYLLANN